MKSGVYGWITIALAVVLLISTILESAFFYGMTAVLLLFSLYLTKRARDEEAEDGD